MFERKIVHRYDDPVDLIWIRAAADLGLKIERSADTFASYDGQGTLTICEASHFDADDCLAQMIFHEICHWLVAGRNGKILEDWGLNNIDDRDLVQEYACIRLQTALSQPFGLRGFMAVTTDWRPYWESLPEDPLSDGEDPAITLAQDAFHRARMEPFEPVLTRSLTATAAIADAVHGIADSTSLWSVTRGRHRLGSLMYANGDLRCGNCAWAIAEPFGLGCRQHKEPGAEFAPAVDSDEKACERWEQPFSIEDCGSCGACCRQGFDLVAADDSFCKLHPELVQLRVSTSEDESTNKNTSECGNASDNEIAGENESPSEIASEYIVPRPNGICVGLDGNGEAANPYRCRHYETRPKNCADFEVAGDACLLARRRVGLSR